MYQRLPAGCRRVRSGFGLLAQGHEQRVAPRNRAIVRDAAEFTDRLFANRERQPSGKHEFDRLCQALGIEHRLTRPDRILMIVM